MRVISRRKIKFAKKYLAEQKKLKEKFNLEQKERKNAIWKKQN